MRNLLSSSLVTLGTTLVCAGAVIGGTAGAAFPGANGRVLFDSTRSGAVNVFSVDPSNSSSVRQITTSADVDETPFGSPNGASVVFRSNRTTGNSQGTLFLAPASADLDQNTLPADGATPLTTAAGDDRDPSFVTDTTVIYSHRDPGGNYELQIVDTATLTVTPVFASPTGCDDTAAVANPTNPAVLAFVRTCAASVAKLFVFDRSAAVSSTNPKDLTAASLAATPSLPVTIDEDPDWAPDGSRIAVAGTGSASLAGGKSRLYSLLPDGTGRTAFWSATGGTGFNDRSPAYSPNGQHLAFSRGQISGSGTDVFTTELSGLDDLSSAGAPSNITPTRGPDLHPNWLRIVTPPNDVPESPLPVLLPVSGVAIVGVGLVLRRRSRSVG